MVYTIRNFAALVISLWYIITGRVRRSVSRALKGDYILSVYFHNPDRRLFTSCIKWLSQKGFHFISLDDLDKIRTGHMPFPKGAVLLTVDDGWKANKSNIIEVVKRLNIPITIFLTVDPVVNGSPFWWSYIKSARDKGMIQFSLAQLKEMDHKRVQDIINTLKNTIVLGREAMTEDQILDALSDSQLTIGSHTISHPILTNCTVEHVYNEMYESKERLQALFKIPVFSFAYPNGAYSKREVELLKKTGYTLAFTTELKPITPNSFENQYELPRMEVLENVSFPETICRMSGVWKT
jgi:peptidoglycan/xylan/chitin deacetylase (PgdA/CDA1 family)